MFFVYSFAFASTESDEQGKETLEFTFIFTFDFLRPPKLSLTTEALA